MAIDRASQLIDAGLWLRLSGDSDGANQLFQRAYGIDPENPRLQSLLEVAPPSNDVPTTPVPQPLRAMGPQAMPAVEPVISTTRSEQIKEVPVAVMELPAPIQGEPAIAMPVEAAVEAVIAAPAPVEPGWADTWLRDGASLPLEAPHPIMLWQTEDLDGRYRIVEKLASGGMGDVYKAVHKELDKRVAIKVMKRELGNAPDFVERFKREAVACSHIGQHNIVDISDFGRTADGRFYFVMEYLEGQTLAALLRSEQRLSVERAVKICLQISRALGAAHSRGIVHRDLKPDNVIIMQQEDRPDFVKVLDFGVAKVSENESSSAGITTTGAGMLMGTPQYMSPEQASALPVDSRSDIYSLGLILYELVTGHPTFQGETPSMVIAAQIHQSPPPMITPAGVAPVPPELEAIVMRMLLKRPQDRPQSMTEVLTALDHVIHGTSPTTVPAAAALVSPATTAPLTVTPATQSQREYLPTRSRLPFALGLGVAVAAIATVGWTTRSRARRPAPAMQTSARTISVRATPPEPTAGGEVEVVEPTPSTTLRVSLDSRPSSVTVLANDVIVGTTPMTLDWLRGRAGTLQFKRDGFAPTSRAIAPQADLALTVELEPLPSRRGTPAKRPVDNLKDLPY